jgi:CRP-like cAMP-binding protein
MGRVTVADLAAFAAAARRQAPLADADLAPLADRLAVLELARGALLLRAGARATQVAVVVRGVLRELYPLPDGGERTKGFAQEGDFVGSLADLLADHPSRASIVAETDARLLVLPFRAFAALAAGSAGWQAFAQRVTTRLYLLKSEREYELLALDAAGRYARFRERFPKLETRVSQSVVASYVGITPVHLSRIRARHHRTARAVGAPARRSPRSR